MKTKLPTRNHINSLCLDLKVLTGPQRIEVLALLHHAEGPVKAGEIVTALGGAQSAISHQLALLRGSNLVEAQRAGRTILYTLTPRGRQFMDAVHALPKV